MNEQVEAIYQQMYAPNEVPLNVKAFFDRVNFLASRIDATNMRGAELALIAAVATSFSGPDIPPIEIPKMPEIVNTSESAGGDEKSYQIPVSLRGPTGPMDAPGLPSKERQARLIESLQKMDYRELIAHAKDFYKIDVRKGKKGNPSKNKIIEMILKNVQPEDQA